MFYSQNPHGSSQPSVTPVQEELTPSSGLQGYQTHKQCTDVHTFGQNKNVKKAKQNKIKNQVKRIQLLENLLQKSKILHNTTS